MGRRILPVHGWVAHLALLLLMSLASALHGEPPVEPFPCQRRVQIAPATPLPEVVVAEFFTHGELHPKGANLAVLDTLDRPVPWRVLQIGPGDFCRLAFQTTRGVRQYRILYGGARSERAPAWTSAAGLLFVARRWKPCNLNRFASVKEAFTSAEHLGSDYVAAVSHHYNPCAPDEGPFLSLYHGALRIDHAGKYVFFTASQDCSFLLIDGKEVVAAPGSHGPVRDARLKGEVTLTAGSHRFEYYHAAASDTCCMLAAWQPPGGAKPELIPTRAFAGAEVVRLTPGPCQHRTRGRLPELTVSILGEVSLATSDLPLIRVQFGESAATTRLRYQWDFGDGQTTTATDPSHIYLAPGIYTVKLTTPQGAAVMNRVGIHRPLLLTEPKKGPDRLLEYRSVLDHYDTTTLNTRLLLQLVHASDEMGLGERAVKMGKARLLTLGAKKEEEDAVYALVKVIGPMLRDRFDDPAGAVAVWKAAADHLRRDTWKLECELEAADICLADLDDRRTAKALLESAAARVARLATPSLVSRFSRIQGDYHARVGNGAAARKAYALAEKTRGTRLATTEQNAWRGAYTRSTEVYLRDRELERALAELRRWQEQFPTDRSEGYLPLLQARYWLARGKPERVDLLANELLVLNRDSPYVDQLLFLAGECEEKLGHRERALAHYRTLATDYPGSPLVKAARAKLSSVAPKPENEKKPLKK